MVGKISAKKTFVDSLDKCKRQWVWLMSTLQVTHLLRTIQWMSHQTGSWAFDIYLFLPPLPGGLKFPGWSAQIYLVLLTVLLFYSCQENLSQRHFLPKRFLRGTWQHSLREPEAGRRASDKDTREMTAPWWSGNSWPLGLAPTTQKRCRAQRHTWTWWSRGHKVINKLNPALTPQAPRLQRAECSCSMENYLPGQRGFPTTEIQQGNGGSQLARPQIASVSHRDTESLQAGVTVGGEETLPGWLSAGHVHEDEGWKDFQ